MTKLKRGLYLVTSLVELAIVGSYFWVHPEYIEDWQALTVAEYGLIVGYVVIALNALVLLVLVIFRQGVTNQLVVESHFGNRLSIDRSAVQTSIEKTLIHQFDAVNPEVKVTLTKRQSQARIKIHAQVARDHQLGSVVEDMRNAVTRNVEETLGIAVGKIKIHLQPVSHRERIKVR